MSKTPNDYLPTVGSSFKGTPKVCSSLKLLCVFIIWTDLFKYTKQPRSQDLQFVGHSSYAEQICSSSEFFGSFGTYAQSIAITLKNFRKWHVDNVRVRHDLLCVFILSQKNKTLVLSTPIYPPFYPHPTQPSSKVQNWYLEYQYKELMLEIK